MWLEVKSLLTVIGAFFICIVLVQILTLNFLFAFLLIMGIFIFVFGDIIIGWMITKNHLQPLMDPMKSNEELCVLFDLSGNIDFVRTRKAPHGKREFVRYGKKASIINNGSYQIKTLNGNRGFVGHESYDGNVDLYLTEGLDILPGDDIKEIYKNLMQQAKNDPTIQTRPRIQLPHFNLRRR